MQLLSAVNQDAAKLAVWHVITVIE